MTLLYRAITYLFLMIIPCLANQQGKLAFAPLVLKYGRSLAINQARINPPLIFDFISVSYMVGRLGVYILTPTGVQMYLRDPLPTNYPRELNLFEWYMKQGWKFEPLYGKSDGKPDAVGFVAFHQRLNQIIICLRGSKDEADWITNFQLFFAPQQGFGQVHAGFARKVASFRKNLFNVLNAFLNRPGVDKYQTSFLVIGHSQGGGLAEITALRVVNYCKEIFGPKYNNAVFNRVILYALSAPRVFDQQGVDNANRILGKDNIIRHNIEGDLVPFSTPTNRVLALIRRLPQAVKQPLVTWLAEKAHTSERDMWIFINSKGYGTGLGYLLYQPLPNAAFKTSFNPERIQEILSNPNLTNPQRAARIGISLVAPVHMGSVKFGGGEGFFYDSGVPNATLNDLNAWLNRRWIRRTLINPAISSTKNMLRWPLTLGRRAN